MTAMTTMAAPWLSSGGALPHSLSPSSSLTFLTRSKIPTKSSASSCKFNSSASLSSSFLSPSFSLSSSFSGLSLGLDLATNVGAGAGRCKRLVVRAGKAALCQTKRSRSRKSLARTHGFRIRMRSTGGRAILKRRRAKGRKILCTKTNANSGKRS